MGLAEMKVYGHLKPGQNGTKRLVDQYGDKPPYILIRGTLLEERLAQLHA